MSEFNQGEFIADEQGEIVEPQHNHEAPEQAEQSQESDQDRNWRALREQKEALEKEKEQLRYQAEQERYKRELLEQQFMQRNAPQKEEVDPLADTSADDWTTRSQVEYLAEKKARAAAEKYIKEAFAQREEADLPNKIRSKFPDFDQVVSKENVDYLRSTKPEIAEALAKIPDKYGQAVAAYEFLKTMNSGMNLSQEKEIAERNAKKPGSLSQVGSEALSRAKAMERGMVPERGGNYYQEMLQAMKGG